MKSLGGESQDFFAGDKENFARQRREHLSCLLLALASFIINQRHN